MKKVLVAIGITLLLSMSMIQEIDFDWFFRKEVIQEVGDGPGDCFIEIDND